jgi:hypothetical protein
MMRHPALRYEVPGGAKVERHFAAYLSLKLIGDSYERIRQVRGCSDGQLRRVTGLGR